MKKLITIIFIIISLNCFSQKDSLKTDTINIKNKVFLQSLPVKVNYCVNITILSYFTINFIFKKAEENGF